MTPAHRDPGETGIVIRLGEGRPQIRQRRPAIVKALHNQPVTRALSMVPSLLPICGVAQSVAAARAVAGARNEPPEPERERQRERQLWREQGFAAAWRCHLSWPQLIGEPRNMAALKQVRDASDDEQLSELLRQCLPGLEGIDSIGKLLDWARRESSVPARTAQVALQSMPGTTRPLAEARCISGDVLLEQAKKVMQQPGFSHLDPAPGSLEVSPLAMARDSLINEIQEELGGTIAARILAQVVDTRVIAEALAHPHSTREACSSWTVSAGAGLGCALTARGPVFHRVTLAGSDSDTVVDWRTLAPTDWHFGARGPVMSALAKLSCEKTAALLVTCFDPCAPWALQTGPGD